MHFEPVFVCCGSILGDSLTYLTFRKITGQHENICKSKSKVSTSYYAYDIFRSPFVPCKERNIITNTSITSVDIFRWATLLRFDTSFLSHFQCNFSFVGHPVYLNRFMLGEKLSAAEQKEFPIRRGSTQGPYINNRVVRK